jgi:hypothetical protein
VLCDRGIGGRAEYDPFLSTDLQGLASSHASSFAARILDFPTILPREC